MIEIDRINLTSRMVGSVEVALQKLFEWKIWEQNLSAYRVSPNWTMGTEMALFSLVPSA